MAKTKWVLERVRLKFVPYDFWIGIFFDWKDKTLYYRFGEHVMVQHRTFYLCLLPFLPIVFDLVRKTAPAERTPSQVAYTGTHHTEIGERHA